MCPFILSALILNLAKNPQNRAPYRRSRERIILKWAETRTQKAMSEKTVTCKVLTDTPVDRVMKGDSLELPEEIANQFAEQKLVELVEIVEKPEPLSEPKAPDPLDSPPPNTPYPEAVEPEAQAWS
jgi:hypothetical protein